MNLLSILCSRRFGVPALVNTLTSPTRAPVVRHLPPTAPDKHAVLTDIYKPKTVSHLNVPVSHLQQWLPQFPLGTLTFFPNQWRIAIKWCILGTAWLRKSLVFFSPFLKANTFHSSILVKGLTMPFLLLFFPSLLSVLLLISSHTRSRAGETNAGKHKSLMDFSTPPPYPAPPAPPL